MVVAGRQWVAVASASSTDALSSGTVTATPSESQVMVSWNVKKVQQPAPR